MTDTRVATDVRFLLDHPDAVMPRFAHEGDAGMDLRSVERITIAPGGRARVDTGLRVAIPDGHAGLVIPRSGLAIEHGISVTNAPGLIDAGYRGRLVVLLSNTASAPFQVEVGDRVAQLVIVRVPEMRAVQVEGLDDTERGSGGFGSSGRS